MRARALSLFLLACAIAAPARAHDTFLWPASFEGTSLSEIRLALSSTEAFPRLQTGPAPDRVAGMTAGISVVSGEAEALRLVLAHPRRGLNVASIALKPFDIELDASQAAHYLDEIGASAEARAAYEALPQPRVLRETYTKYAKTIFCIFRCAGFTRAIARVGHELEFVAFADRDGVTLRRFVLYAHNAPASDQAVAATTADGQRRMLRTNAMGIVDLPDDVHGPTLLSATILHPPATPDARFTSDFATLTFVAP